jgi:hypothetical protein
VGFSHQQEGCLLRDRPTVKYREMHYLLISDCLAD